MIKYKIEKSGHKHPVPKVVFGDKKYEMVGTFLMTEARMFGEEIMDAVDAVIKSGKSGEFAGNVFSLAIAPDSVKITDDISGRECEMQTEFFREITAKYLTAFEESE